MNLTRPDARISGGIAKIETALMEDLDYFRYNSVNNTATINFKNGKSFDNNYFSPKSAKFTPEINPTNNGKEHVYSLLFNIPGITNDNELKIMQNSEKLHLVRITDNNGTRLILPYCKITSPHDIGKIIQDFTGYTVIFSVKLPHRAPIDMTLGIELQSIAEDQYSIE